MKQIFSIILILFFFVGFSQETDGPKNQINDDTKWTWNVDAYIISVGNGFLPYSINIPNQLLARGGGQGLGVGLEFLYPVLSIGHDEIQAFIGGGFVFQTLSYRFKQGLDNSNSDFINYTNIKDDKRLVSGILQMDIPLIFKFVNKTSGAAINFQISPLSTYLANLNSTNVYSGFVSGVGLNAEVALSVNFNNLFYTLGNIGKNK